MATIIALTIGGLIIGIGLWSYAYRLGVRHGRSMNVPFRLIDELLDHKIHCCRQDPAAARIELENIAGIEEWESQSLVQQVVHTGRPAHQHDSAAHLPLDNSAKKVA